MSAECDNNTIENYNKVKVKMNCSQNEKYDYIIDLLAECFGLVSFVIDRPLMLHLLSSACVCDFLTRHLTMNLNQNCQWSHKNCGVSFQCEL